MAGGALPALQAPGSSIRVLKPSSRGQACGAYKLASLRRRQARWLHVPALATAAPEKGYQRREESVREPPSQPPKDPSPGPVLVAVTVPNCRLGSGEELRLVGDSPELGGWELAAAPPLSRSPDGSTWEVVLPLMPGQYECKLLIARSNRGGVVCWEGGPNRQLRVPHLGGLEVPPGVPLWQGVCRFGDTSKTLLKASPKVDLQQLKDAATAAVQRRAELTEKRDTLTARLDHLTHEVESSEVRVASKRGELQQMVASKRGELQQMVADELAQLKQRGVVSQQVARLEGNAATALAATPAAPGAPAAPPATAPSPRPTPRPEQTPAAAAAQAASKAVHSSGESAAAARDGSSEFRFQGQQGEQAGPSAFQLAKKQLMELLPAEAEAALEARWQRERLAAAAASAKPTPAPSSARAEPKYAVVPAPQPSAAAKAAATAMAPPTPAAKPQPQSSPAAVPVVAPAAAAKAAAAKAAAAKGVAQAAALKAAVNRIKVAVPPTAAKLAASPTPSVPAASSEAAVLAGKPQQAAQQEQAAQIKDEVAKAPAALQRTRGDISSVMNKPSMPVVAALAVSQQMFQAYRALWGCALAAVLPTPAAQRGVDTVAAVTLGVVASIPFWG